MDEQKRREERRSGTTGTGVITYLTLFRFFPSNYFYFISDTCKPFPKVQGFSQFS